MDFVKAQHAAMHCCALVMDGEVISVILWVQVWVLNAVELHGLADMVVTLRGSTAEAARRAAQRSMVRIAKGFRRARGFKAVHRVA
jgi:hypothetical protein